MFDALTDKLQGIFSGLKGRGKLTESDIDQAMRAIRLSLLEADVSLPVVKQLTTAIAARAKGAEVMESLTPDQQVVKIVSDELTALMGEANVALPLASKPPDHRPDGRPPGLGQDDLLAPSWPLLPRTRAARPCSSPATCTARPPPSSSPCWARQIGVPVHREEGVRDAVAIARAASTRPAAPGATW